MWETVAGCWRPWGILSPGSVVEVFKGRGSGGTKMGIPQYIYICACVYVLSTWKLNAFTCFAASSWGERIVEVDACGVQLVFGKHGFDY